MAAEVLFGIGSEGEIVSSSNPMPVIPFGSSADTLLSERVTNTDGVSTALTTFGATAGQRNFVTAISVYNSGLTEGYIDFRDGAAGAVLYTVPLPAEGGAVMCNGGVPLFATSVNTALAYDVSGALTTAYISLSGFKA